MGLLRFLKKAMFKNRGTNYRMTTKRLGILLLAAAIYLPIEFLVWFGLGLDELFYPDYRKVSLPKPVFIIGNPRSGTTFLQRLLAKDTDNFHCMCTWEIFTAPSVFMRKLVQFVEGIGGVLGVPISKRVGKIEELWKDTDDVHRLKLRSPEEDEYLFLHNFSTMKIWSYAAMEEESEPYIYFDQKMTSNDKKRIMDYYQSCLQRHHYFHGNQKEYYLSKNPNFSPAVQTLIDRFPEAKFIYLIRNPLEAVPSHISLKAREWRILGSPLEKYSCRDFIIKSSQHWYEYPLSVLGSLPENQAVIVKFDDLVSDAEAAVQNIYNQLGLSLSEDFRKVLAVETVHARNHESDHQYSLEEMGIKPQQMAAEFADVIHKFGFEGLEQ
jgi:omega-hydroxy-beta-dihydromenaquinone-9 sulfotransferase